MEEWLGIEMEERGLEKSIQGHYIMAILDDDETREEKRKVIEEMLTASLVDAIGIDQLCDEILRRWDVEVERRKKGEGDAMAAKENKRKNGSAETDEFAKLAGHLRPTHAASSQDSLQSIEEKKKREKLLLDYGYEEEEEVEGVEGAEGEEGGEEDRFVNDNARRVKEEEEKKRLESKAAHEKKVQRDKESLAKDKQNKEEKKEKRKPVKQEKKRM